MTAPLIIPQLRALLDSGMALHDALNAAEAIEKGHRPKRSASTKDAKATRLPVDWWPDNDLAHWALAELGGDKTAARRETEGFRDYWHAVPGARGTKLDWPATYRNAIRRAAARIPRNRNVEHGNRTDAAFDNILDRLGHQPR